MTQRRVYLVDEDAFSRRYLALETSGIGMEPWPFSSAAHFAEMLDHLEPGCVVISGSSCNFDGLGALAELVRRGITWPVIVIGREGDFRSAYDALKLGAFEFLAAPFPPEELREVLTRGAAALAEAVEAGRMHRLARERVERLSPRELDVALALMEGMANKAVAHLFGISVRTVEMHRANVLRKLQVRNLAEGAVLLYQARGTRPR
ncbi:MAG TPA: LuxR C-terminal-related transcriptional regulator [Allosphingosinicella sp.]|jgi:FixJ family two-component response regulator